MQTLPAELNWMLHYITQKNKHMTYLILSQLWLIQSVEDLVVRLMLQCWRHHIQWAWSTLTEIVFQIYSWQFKMKVGLKYSMKYMLGENNIKRGILWRSQEPTANKVSAWSNMMTFPRFKTKTFLNLQILIEMDLWLCFSWLIQQAWTSLLITICCRVQIKCNRRRKATWTLIISKTKCK